MNTIGFKYGKELKQIQRKQKLEKHKNKYFALLFLVLILIYFLLLINS